MTILDLRPLSVGEILDRTFTLYRRNFKLFVGITALPQLIGLAASLARIFTLGNNNSRFSLISIVALLASVLVLLLVSMYSQAASFLAVNDLYLGRPVTASDCLRRALDHISTVFVVTILTGLAVLAGAIFLIIPGIWIFCRLIVALPAALIEQRVGSDAVSRSWHLTRDNAGRAFVIALLYFVIAIAAGMLFQLPLGIAVVVYRNNPAMLQMWTAVSQVGEAIINILVTPIFMIATSVFYFDLRVRKEGFDLQMMLDPNSERSTPPGTGSVPSILA
ncbi:MAG TPA: glycerophosphoryl diester phosphodiesterase membrane domain-containing protein [Bryobacteraceae bacterium]|nr:glycerophosphoryl diester phosphodiesterase membrane domain-containing protein [Bryobacteraceae bacterium]